MRNILVYEADQSRIPHLVFLLNLADIRCSVARSTEELLNWLSAVRLEVTRFDLLLLHSWQQDEVGRAVLKRILATVSLPVIYVARESGISSEPHGEGVIRCTPDTLLSCLDEHLQRIDSPAMKEA